MLKIFNKSIDIDDNRWISWYQSFGLGPFHQPDSMKRIHFKHCNCLCSITPKNMTENDEISFYQLALIKPFC